LASVFLQQQPSFASAEEEDAGTDLLVDDADGEQREATLKPRAMGSVAALTTGLRSRIDSPETTTRARAALDKLLGSFDPTGWVSIEFDESAVRPWVLRAIDPPRNFRQQPKVFANEVTAIRNADLLVEELRYSHAGVALRLPRKQVKIRRSGGRKFTAIELLFLANATDAPPTSLVA
jgi:hypothetical protein